MHPWLKGQFDAQPGAASTAASATLPPSLGVTVQRTPQAWVVFRYRDPPNVTLLTLSHLLTAILVRRTPRSPARVAPSVGHRGPRQVHLVVRRRFRHDRLVLVALVVSRRERVKALLQPSSETRGDDRGRGRPRLVCVVDDRVLTALQALMDVPQHLVPIGLKKVLCEAKHACGRRGPTPTLLLHSTTLDRRELLECLPLVEERVLPGQLDPLVRRRRPISYPSLKVTENSTSAGAGTPRTVKGVKRHPFTHSRAALSSRG